MAHFARINKITKEVLHVHCVDNKDCIDQNTNKESELVGIEYLKKVHANQSWINDVEFVQTSYNGSIRKRFAGKGHVFDSTKNGFIPQKPFESWVLNNDTLNWEPPLSMPNDGKRYDWDEKTQRWKEI